MTTKNIKSRIQHKHDTEENWLKATNFIPMIGELIVYDPDSNHSEPRLKIGDGQTLVNDLPFTAVSLSDLTAILDDYAKIENVPTKVSQLENDSQFISEEYVEAYFKRLNSDNVLRFYCIEDVTIIINGVSTVYPANSNVEVKFLATDIWEVVPTSDNSILALNAFPGALGTYYSWLEGVKQFSNILFDMNNVDMYSKWSQGHQGEYKVQFAQYLNCIFWSDNAYISDVNKRTNYTLYYSSQLPLCYSSIPDNTFKAFYLAFSVNSDPNWSNEAYRDSFAKATWATQVFSYYGARTIGIFGHDNPKFNIVLPKDCRGLMYAATAVENAGNFDATNVTKFGAKSGSWQEAFGQCVSLRNLYIKNLKVNLNISWSPVEYDSISYIIDKAANTNKITISVSPYTYNLLRPADFELASSKNITIELLTTNYIEDRRLSALTVAEDKITIDRKLEVITQSENTSILLEGTDYEWNSGPNGGYWESNPFDGRPYIKDGGLYFNHTGNVNDSTFFIPINGSYSWEDEEYGYTFTYSLIGTPDNLILIDDYYNSYAPTLAPVYLIHKIIGGTAEFSYETLSNINNRLDQLESTPSGSLKFVGTSINLMNTATSSEQRYEEIIGNYVNIYSGTFTCSATISSRTSKIEGFIINRTFISMADLYAMKNNNVSFNILYYGFSGETNGLEELKIKDITVSGASTGNQLTYTITCDYKLNPGAYPDLNGDLDNDWTVGFQYKDISLVSPYPEVQY